MNEASRTAFGAYTTLVQERLKIDHATESDAEFLERVRRTEELQPFGALAAALSREYDRPGDLRIAGQWEYRIRNYMRMSGHYERVRRAATLATEEETGRFERAIEARQTTMHLLAPLEYFEMHEDRLDFAGFQIRRFSTADLEAITSNETRRLFYPYAHLNIGTLSDYWCIYATVAVDNEEPYSAGFDFSGRISLSYSDYPGPVQEACRYLALCDWGTHPMFGDPAPRQTVRATYENWNGPFRPHIPFVILAADSLTEDPPAAPRISQLEREPNLDPETGEEMGDRPAHGLWLDDSTAFKSFIDRCIELVDSIRPRAALWQYAETALNFLLKGFLSEGFDQLLWNMVAMEAVAGQRGGSTRLLAARIARICANDHDDEGRVTRRFDTLRDLRDQLVHGNPRLAAQQVFEGHLAEARDMARGSVLWMLNYINHAVRSAQAVNGRLPSRDDLLTILDVAWDYRERAAAFWQGLPATFPQVTDWR